jgi:serine/threonine protein phosphatase PrpC
MGSILCAPVRNQLLTRVGNDDFRIGCSQMQGFRVEMEDAHSICLALEGHPNTSLFAVYDGHAGELVAKYLARDLPGHLAKLEQFDDQSLKKAMLEFDADVGRQDFKNQGSTCTFALVEQHESSTSTSSKSWRVTAVNIGDSRVMLVKANGKLEKLTEDHKPEDWRERQRIEKAGGFVRENRVDGGLAMSRAIGDYTYKMESKLGQLEQKVIALPDIKHTDAYPGDRLLVICDGIVERLTSEDVAQYVHNKHKQLKEEPAEVMRDLLYYSLAVGSTDNQSGILISFEDGNGYSRDDEFLAGPLSEWRTDKKFMNAYLKNAEAWGKQKDDLIPLIAEAEKTIDSDWRNFRKQEGGNPFMASKTLLLIVTCVFFVFYLVYRNSMQLYDGESADEW